MLGRRLPITSGSLGVEGLDGEIVIRRDERGIPHVSGSSDHDVWLGLGFCHAQDRAFQLESVRRVAHGTLAEIVGPEGLPIDKLVRRLGFLRYARRQMAALDEDVRETISAYVAGINRGLALGGKRKAHEFVLLRSRPSAWEPVDVLAVAKLLSFAMSGNWDAELARFRVLMADGHDALKSVDPEYAAWHPVTAPGETGGEIAGEDIDRLSGDLAALTGALGMSGGSNAWAVAGSKTGTGRPILANDPHLPPRLPSPWYLAHLQTPGWAMVGATFVGVPIVAAGHNGRVAWGTTLGLADTSDLYIERPPQGGGEDGEIEVTETIREEIRVKGKPTVTEEVRVTPRGPLLTPAIDGGGHAISLRAMWMEPRPIRGFLRVSRVCNAEEFRQTFEAWPLMPLNVVFADVDGAIGWQLVGETPVRRVSHGIVPSAAWTGDGEWEADPVPFADMPGAAHPDAGYLISANHRPVPADHRLPDGSAGPFLGVDWADGLRAARIGERLAESDGWDVAGTSDLQVDLVTAQWGEVREAVLAIRPRNAESREALGLLAGWDGEMSGRSAAAAVFELLLGEIDRRDVAGRAPLAGKFVLGASIGGLAVPNMLAFRRAGRLSRLLRDGPPPGPPGAGRSEERWQGLLSDALEATVSRLSERAGPEPGRWRWGEVRPLTLEHPVGRKKPLDGVFNIGPVPFGGDTNTVAQAAVDPLDSFANPMVIPSLRCVMDVGDFGHSTFVLPSGQSGNPLSPHYDDMFPLWLRGEGVPIAWSDEEVGRATVTTLRLVPPAP